MHTRKKLRSILSRDGLEDHADEVIDSLLPTVRLRSGKDVVDKLKVGASKFGGHPDLPQGKAHPTRNGEPLHLLMQLRLADLPHKHLKDLKLPKVGILWAWVDKLSYFELPPNNRIDGRTPYGHLDPATYQLTYSEEETLLKRTPFPGYSKKNDSESVEPFPQTKLTPFATQTLSPNIRQRHWDAIGSTTPAWHLSLDATREIEEDEREGNHQLFSGVETLEEDLQFEAEALSNNLLPWSLPAKTKKKFEAAKVEWRFFLKLDSDFRALGWCWGDAGSLFWYIRDRDLNARKFENAIGMSAAGG